MKTTGGRDTFLLFIALLLAIGSICYFFVIKKSLRKLKEAEADLIVVENEKKEKDAIIQQAAELNVELKKVRDSIIAIEKESIPELNSDAITRKLYKYFEDAGLKYYVDVENSEVKYETVTMPDGTINPNRADYSSYTVQVSGTDGWLLTHDEAKAYDDNSADPTVNLTQAYYEQLALGVGNDKMANQSLAKMGLGDKKLEEIYSSEYVGYKEFVAALKTLEDAAPNYVKITNIGIEDQGQGFCYYTATVNVYAFKLVSPEYKKDDETKNIDLTQKDYMVWTGDANIATGGLVGLPNYFTVANGCIDLPDGHPLKDKYLSFINFDFSVNRPFAAWNMWSYEWLTLEQLVKDAAKNDPAHFLLEVQLATGKITQEEYTKLMEELAKNDAANNNTNTTENNATT